MNRIQLAWSLSLIAAGLLSITIIVSSSLDIGLPDTLVRLLGLAELAVIFVLVLTTVLKIRAGK